MFESLKFYSDVFWASALYSLHHHPFHNILWILDRSFGQHTRKYYSWHLHIRNGIGNSETKSLKPWIRVFLFTHASFAVLSPCPAQPGYVLPLQTVQIQISWLLKKSTDLELHCLPLSMWIYINNLDQVIWLAENQKLAWHLNLFSRTRVKIIRATTWENAPPYMCSQRKYKWSCLGNAIITKQRFPGAPKEGEMRNK